MVSKAFPLVHPSLVILLGLLRREKTGFANIGFESILVLVLYFGAVAMLATGDDGAGRDPGRVDAFVVFRAPGAGISWLLASVGAAMQAIGPTSGCAE